MRAPALALAVLAGAACGRRSLQADAGGTGSITFDATGSDGAPAGDGGPGGVDGPALSLDARLPGDTATPLDPNCGVTTIAGGYVPADFLVLVDRSPAGDQPQWNELLRALAVQILPAGRSDWGLYSFPKFGPLCGSVTVPSTIDVPVAPGRQPDVGAGLINMTSGGDGMPTAAAIDVGLAHLRTLPPGNPKALMLVTNRAPSCAGAGDRLSADPVQAQADAVAAITAAASAEGITTFVLAPSTTATSDAAALNALATAGGRARLQGGPAFYTEATLPELFTPLSFAQSCVVPLDAAPPVPNGVTVTFNGAPVPRDTEHVNGWDYVASQTAYDIELYGTWCAMLLEERAFEIRVVFACPIRLP